LGELTGVTFQQVQKYETGVSRVSASRLYTISTVLGVSVNDLCERPTRSNEGRSWPDISGVPQTRLTYELFRHALALPADRRRVLLDMARAAAG
jgi:transcriptional regulator with XRE-family HTH domain